MSGLLSGIFGGGWQPSAADRILNDLTQNREDDHHLYVQPQAQSAPYVKKLKQGAGVAGGLYTAAEVLQKVTTHIPESVKQKANETLTSATSGAENVGHAAESVFGSTVYNAVSSGFSSIGSMASRVHWYVSWLPAPLQVAVYGAGAFYALSFIAMLRSSSGYGSSNTNNIHSNFHLNIHPPAGCKPVVRTEDRADGKIVHVGMECEPPSVQIAKKQLVQLNRVGKALTSHLPKARLILDAMECHNKLKDIVLKKKLELFPEHQQRDLRASKRKFDALAKKNYVDTKLGHIVYMTELTLQEAADVTKTAKTVVKALEAKVAESKETNKRKKV